MKKYTIIGGVMTLALVFTLTLAASTYANYMGNGNGNGQGNKPEITEEMKEAQAQIKEAVANGDYETFKSLVSEMPNGEKKLETMTEEKFNEMNERHLNRANLQENREEVRNAVANGDYEAWKVLVAEMPNGSEMLEKINESNFGKLTEAHNLMEEGRAKMEEARAIMNELGLERPQMKGGSGNKMGQMKNHFQNNGQ